MPRPADALRERARPMLFGWGGPSAAARTAFLAVAALITAFVAAPTEGLAKSPTTETAPAEKQPSRAAPPSAPQTDPASGAGPLLWRISDADSTLWIYGSLHYLPPDLVWRRPGFDAAFAEADLVYFETALDDAMVAQLQERMLELGVNPPGETLSSQLSPETWRLAREVAASVGLSAALLEPYKPWLAGIAIESEWMVSRGSLFDAGVDNVMEREAEDAGKEIRTFETGEFQLGIFADQTPAVQLAVFEATLRMIDQNPAMFDTLTSAWMTRDVATMEQLLADMLAPMPEVFVERLLYRRNRAWAAELDAWMAGEGVALVIVGAGHMAGPENLIDLLAERGHVAEVQ